MGFSGGLGWGHGHRGFSGELMGEIGGGLGDGREGGRGNGRSFSRCGRRGFGGGRVGDAHGLIGVDGGEGAKKLAADESENGGAASGDVVGGEQLEDIPQSQIDALSGLKALRVGKKRFAEVQAVGPDEFLGVHAAKKLSGSGDRHLAASARGGAVGAASGVIGGVGATGFVVHFFLDWGAGL